MAAGAWTVYTQAVVNLGKKTMDLSADTFVLTLVTNSYVPNANTDAAWSAVSANELSTAGGYTAGGVALTGQTWTNSLGTTTFTCANPSWATFSAGPFRYGVIVHRAAGALAAGDLLLSYSDLGGGGTITGTGGTFTVTINASGVFQVTHTP